MGSDYKKILVKKKIMRKTASIYKVFCGFPLRIVRFCGKKIIGDANFACNLMIPYSQAMENNTDCYVTYDLHPKKAVDVNNWLYYSGGNASQCCIVMQGPLRTADDFTLETVKYYKKVFPNVSVIVSTWINEDKKTIHLLKKETNCIVIQNELPSSAGDGNINYQRVSSYYGMCEAIRQNKKYVLKTRTDTRITMPGIFDDLVELLKNHPINDVGIQNERVIFFNAYAFLPFNESGTFYFGEANDLKLMFSNEKAAEIKYKDGYNGNLFAAQKITYRMLFKKGSSLMDFSKFFFEKVGENVECNIKQWWEICGRRAICLPIAYLRPLWLKYDFNHENSDFLWLYRRSIMGSCGMDNTMINYGMWLDMKNNVISVDAEAYSYLLDQPML
ncbi:WavE lipopolysaccharide synthesis family protein [Butyrivibrio sp. INlla16]|uniref:WavE lipopolysaccharide synthesis family protein n=1 Tax=Butyrivibrio sp. INlla16 TaxID=1520807 RepID=UPI0008869F75|nr:WavE lipopolysaccharide synthesis family protein [Butyrivibrio sp. INlla16]SDB67343.1 WavE lipopolysaccharide synthesis [Butyrivibrio sp. INlla16]